MAGQWRLAGTQPIDPNDGLPIIGAKAYFYVGGTSTPLPVFTTAALTVPHEHPLTTDANGRWPAVFMTESGTFRIRLTTAAGADLFEADNEPVLFTPPPAAGTPDFDVTGVATTGFLQLYWGSSAPTGWLLCNGRTLGSTASGAAYANENAEALFLHLWPTPSLTVSGGRGTSAAADWTANKTITTPDSRGRVLAGLDQMGAASAAGRMTGFTTLGESRGEETVTLTSDQIPAHTHSGTTDPTSHDHDMPFSESGLTAALSGGGVVSGVSGVDTSTSAETEHVHDYTTSSVGGGQSHSNVQPTMGLTIIIKL